MLYHMMEILPTLLVLALFGAFLLIIGIGFAFVVREFCHIGRSPQRYVPCPDTLPCLDRDPQQVKTLGGRINSTTLNF